MGERGVPPAAMSTLFSLQVLSAETCRDTGPTAGCTVIDPPTLSMHASYAEMLLRQR